MAFSFFKRNKEKSLKNQVEFCMTNLSLGAADAYDVLVEREDVEITESGCTSNCEICECHLFAIVNGELLKAQDANELVKIIQEELEMNSIAF
ncbi:hypothetical protein DCE79_05175 [Lysinibacillus sp. 2017]|uniref:DUF1450 domain-containing protein n=1 Tax=unclassified Lysinibacillus TaxID=2636778 RepID=UPI000D528D9B|nr:MULTISPECIES: DUF1450 domain-containing protein [unclassified Lysinibacillus]AWE06823.1 hypothetical protein DCE79_05175 [Lysinibacillus sp. 2017]TGN37246.1 DUF1450 domain-containing protein [Lysinibacillus sp. S2017]